MILIKARKDLPFETWGNTYKILKGVVKRMDVPPMIFTGNPLIIKSGMVFFMHMILMDSEAQLAMNLGETYLVTESGNERLGKQKLDLVIL
jgi:Xaa-Pro aminopeptidase